MSSTGCERLGDLVALGEGRAGVLAGAGLEADELRPEDRQRLDARHGGVRHLVALVDAQRDPRPAVVEQLDAGDRADVDAAQLHVGPAVGEQPLARRREHGVDLVAAVEVAACRSDIATTIEAGEEHGAGQAERGHADGRGSSWITARLIR